MWKFSALGKSMLIHCADFFIEKMAGDGAHDQLPLQAFLNIFFFKFSGTNFQMRRNSFCLRRGYINHKHFATSSALCAIYLRSYNIVQTKHHLVQGGSIFVI